MSQYCYTSQRNNFSWDLINKLSDHFALITFSFSASLRSTMQRNQKCCHLFSVIKSIWFWNSHNQAALSSFIPKKLNTDKCCNLFYYVKCLPRNICVNKATLCMHFCPQTWGWQYLHCPLFSPNDALGTQGSNMKTYFVVFRPVCVHHLIFLSYKNKLMSEWFLSSVSASNFNSLGEKINNLLTLVKSDLWHQD